MRQHAPPQDMQPAVRLEQERQEQVRLGLAQRLEVLGLACGQDWLAIFGAWQAQLVLSSMRFAMTTITRSANGLAFKRKGRQKTWLSTLLLPTFTASHV